MKIAVTSQNRKIITEHAGRCRKFWIFSIDNAVIVDKQLLELPIEQSFHASSAHEPHPLDDIDVLITAGMGSGMVRRLARKGIIGLITEQTDPDTAVALYLTGELNAKAASEHASDCHKHGH